MNKAVNAVAICWAMIPLLYLLGFWADVAPPLCEMAYYAFWATLVAATVTAFFFASWLRANRHQQFEFKRSLAVAITYVVSALLCASLSYAGIDQTEVVTFEGVFKKVVVVRSNYKIVFDAVEGPRECRIDSEFVDRVRDRIGVDEKVKVSLYGSYVCRLIANGAEVISIRDYENGQRSLGQQVAGCLVVFALLYWLLALPRVVALRT